SDDDRRRQAAAELLAKGIERGPSEARSQGDGEGRRRTSGKLAEAQAWASSSRSVVVLEVLGRDTGVAPMRAIGSLVVAEDAVGSSGQSQEKREGDDTAEG